MKDKISDKPVGELIQVGGEVDESCVTLRFFGEDLEPDTLTALLGCSPTHAVRRGDPFPKIGCSQRARMGSWRLAGPTESGKSLDQQIMDILCRVNSDLSIWKQLSEKYDADLFCGLWLNDANRSTKLSPRVTKEISARGLELNLDIYFNGTTDVEPVGPS